MFGNEYAYIRLNAFKKMIWHYLRVEQVKKKIYVTDTA